MSKTNYQKMTDGQKLATWMAEVGTCVYNQLKKAEITMGLVHMLDGTTPKKVHPVYSFLQEDNTIEQAENYLNENIKKTTGFEYVFNFDEDEIKHIFDGEVELRYEEDDNEHFVPTVYLGMKPQVKKEKSASLKTSKKDQTYESFKIDDDLVNIDMSKMTKEKLLKLPIDYLDEIANIIGITKQYNNKEKLVDYIVQTKSKEIIEFYLNDVDNINKLIDDIDEMAYREKPTVTEYFIAINILRGRIDELKGFLKNPKKIVKQLEKEKIEKLTESQYRDLILKIRNQIEDMKQEFKF